MLGPSLDGFPLFIPGDGLLRSKQLTQGTLDTDRLTDIPIQILSTRYGINMTVSTVSELLVVGSGETAIILGIMFEATQADTVTVPAIVGLGIAAGEDDIFSDEMMQSFDTAGDTWTNWLVFSGSRAASPGESISVSITGATATALVADIHLIGFLV